MADNKKKFARKRATPKRLRELFKEWFYKVPGSRYNRFCKHCYHRGGLDECEPFCDWFGCECVDAVRKYCPIPTTMVSMLMENCEVPDTENQGQTLAKKGDTVVSPSNFQFVSTESVETQEDGAECSRPHGSARARLRGDTPTATPKNYTEINEFWRKFNIWLDRND